MKNARVYEVRRAIAKFYVKISNMIGIPMALIGTGGDYGEMHPRLLIIGFALMFTGSSLLYILSEAESDYNIAKSRKERESNVCENV